MSCVLKLVEILPQTKIESLECAPAPTCFVFMSAPVYTAVFTASRLIDNSLGGYYDKDHNFVANTEGITKLSEALKGSAVTSLKCAAAPKVIIFLVSAPIDMPQLPPLLPCSQYLEQLPWLQGSSRSRQGPQGQHHTAIPQVGRLALEPARSVRLSAPIGTSLTWQILHSPCAHAFEVVCSRAHAHALVPTQSRKQQFGWRDRVHHKKHGTGLFL